MKTIGLRFASLFFVGFALVACSGGGEPAQPEAPAPTEPTEPSDSDDNRAPTAVAGEARVVPVGSEVEVDGTESSDPDGDPLSFEWEFASKPSGSEADFHDATSRTPRFVADKAGKYEVELTVSDGIASAKDSVIIRANSDPIANAGVDQTVALGEEVILDGSASSDPDGDAMSYAWAFISRPDGSEVELEDADSAVSSFVADTVGHYLVELTVSDGHAEASARVNINITKESGVETGILYVAPSGDDDNAGTKSEPLETVGESMARVEENSDIHRIVLASGTYEEDFDHNVPGKLQIVGPAEGEAAAILKGVGNLFRVFGANTSLTLLRVTLESEDIALRVLSNGALTMSRVECQAKGCIDGTDEYEAQTRSGAVQVSNSKLVGITEATAGIGLQNGGLKVIESTIEGFATGVYLVDSSLIMQNTTIEGVTKDGLSLHMGWNMLIEESEINVAQGRGIYNYDSDILIKGTELSSSNRLPDSSDIGIELAGTSSVEADNIKIEGFGGQRSAGGAIELGSSPGKKRLTLRNTEISGNLTGIVVRGRESEVDLGNQAEDGKNIVSGFRITGRNPGYSIYDLRPEGSDAYGFIRLKETKLTGEELPAGSYISTHALNCEEPYRFCIENKDNTIRAY